MFWRVYDSALYFTYSHHHRIKWYNESCLQESVLFFNKSNVHLVDNIFWYYGFKTESQGEQVIIAIIVFYLLIQIIEIIGRFVLISPII